jgi:hypothetical protein
MFRIQLRRVTLALAGGLLVASSLMSSIAAAAPADSLPLPSGIEANSAKKPHIDLPVADLSVTPLGLTADATFQHVHYRFRITNNGPDRMTFQYHLWANWIAYGQPNGTQDGGTYTETRNPGESLDVEMYCQIGGDPSHYCGSGEATVSPVNSLDSNPSNNSFEMLNTFQP